MPSPSQFICCSKFWPDAIQEFLHGFNFLWSLVFIIKIHSQSVSLFIFIQNNYLFQSFTTLSCSSFPLSYYIPLWYNAILSFFFFISQMAEPSFINSFLRFLIDFWISFFSFASIFVKIKPLSDVYFSILIKPYPLTISSRNLGLNENSWLAELKI